MSLALAHFYSSPVQVAKVTPRNMAEVAEWCGGTIGKVESRRRTGQMDDVIEVPTTKKNTINKAFPGMYITKRLTVNPNGELKATYAVYHRDFFDRSYYETPQIAVERTWELLEDSVDDGKQAAVETSNHGLNVQSDAVTPAKKRIPTSMQAAMDRAKERVEKSKTDIPDVAADLASGPSSTTDRQEPAPVPTTEDFASAQEEIVQETGPISPSELVTTGPVAPAVEETTEPVVDTNEDAHFGLPVTEKEADVAQEDELAENKPPVEIEKLNVAHQIVDAAVAPENIKEDAKTALNEGTMSPEEAVEAVGVDAKQVDELVSEVVETPADANLGWEALSTDGLIVESQGDPAALVQTDAEPAPEPQPIQWEVPEGATEGVAVEGAKLEDKKKTVYGMLDDAIQDEKLRLELKSEIARGTITPEEALEMAGLPALDAPSEG